MAGRPRGTAPLPAGLGGPAARARVGRRDPDRPAEPGRRPDRRCAHQPGPRPGRRGGPPSAGTRGATVWPVRAPPRDRGPANSARRPVIESAVNVTAVWLVLLPVFDPHRDSGMRKLSRLICASWSIAGIPVPVNHRGAPINHGNGGPVNQRGPWDDRRTQLRFAMRAWSAADPYRRSRTRVTRPSRPGCGSSWSAPGRTGCSATRGPGPTARRWARRGRCPPWPRSRRTPGAGRPARSGRFPRPAARGGPVDARVRAGRGVTPVRLGVLLLPEHAGPGGTELWRRVEQLPVQHAWTYDHLCWRPDGSGHAGGLAQLPAPARHR
jgi:hypothetical protein